MLRDIAASRASDRAVALFLEAIRLVKSVVNLSGDRTFQISTVAHLAFVDRIGARFDVEGIEGIGPIRTIEGHGKRARPLGRAIPPPDRF